MFFTAILLQLPAFSQPSTDEQLASQYYQNKEFDKAQDYYEKLFYKVSPQLYYQSYFNCLLETKTLAKPKSWSKNN